MTQRGKKMEMLLIYTLGLPASGKTTWANERVAKDKGQSVLVCKDDIRVELQKHGKVLEKEVIQVEDEQIKTALKAGKDVIVADTNLNPFHKERLTEIAAEYGAEILCKNFTHISLQECIRRDKLRENSVGENVIRSMHNQYIKPKRKVKRSFQKEGLSR